MQHVLLLELKHHACRWHVIVVASPPHHVVCLALDRVYRRLLGRERHPIIQPREEAISRRQDEFVLECFFCQEYPRFTMNRFSASSYTLYQISINQLSSIWIVFQASRTSEDEIKARGCASPHCFCSRWRFWFRSYCDMRSNLAVLVKIDCKQRCSLVRL